MVRMYLFQEKIYPILIRELMKYEDAIDKNNLKAINSILEHVIIDGSPLSEKKRSSLEFIRTNRDKILEDIRKMKTDSRALVYHPSSVTYPPKLRIIAKALLPFEEQFRKKDFQDPEFRATVKKEVNEMALKEGFRIRHVESYFVEYYDQLLIFLDELKVEKHAETRDEAGPLDDNNENEDSKDSPEAPEQDDANDDKDKKSIEKHAESKDEDLPKDERSSEAEISADKKQRATPTPIDGDKLQLQVKVKKLSSQEVKEGVVMISSSDNESIKIEGEESLIDVEGTETAAAKLKSSEDAAEDDDHKKEVEEGAGTPMDVDSLKKDKKLSKSTRINGKSKKNGKSNEMKKQDDSSSSEKSSEAVENNEETGNFGKLENMEEDDLLEFAVKSLELNDWGVGQMAWTLVDRLIYWPCIVTKDANSNQHINTQYVGGKTITKIHVKCFGEFGEDRWVDKDSLIESTDGDDAEKFNMFNNAIKVFKGLRKKDIHERIDEIAPKKRRACSQAVGASQEPVSKKIRFEEEESQ